ncbi:hypothetical protein D0T53_06545 [Dysgonomonas sp. 216]|uniref:DUF4625 domain-containing protein n=1 Tax=Dysgonomonas sp. 216 TaxID=2302934 RepID=UPI0013D3104C|nr:DUF4625 domain-containing protein [Dysgonomonas sp. 216]NDW18573.1 hypothetical protein [Dysgonomonas sp. 216]
MARIFYTLSVLYILSSILLSCSGSDDDNQKPRIDNFRVGDTILIGDSVINYIYADLSDNGGLSTFRIQIMPSPSMQKPDSVVRDSFALQKHIRRWSFFGKDTATLNTGFVVPSISSYYDKTTGKSTNYPTRTGEYILRYSCIDLAGNQDSSEVSITILYPKKQVTE